MRIGPYSLFPELPGTLWRNISDASRVRRYGIPRLPGDTPEEIATAILVHNAKEVLSAGQGHFLYMWPSDFGKAIRGALRVLPKSYLGNLIELMIIESNRLGHVSSCFSPEPGFHGFDMPYARADNLPWLLHALFEYETSTQETTLTKQYQPELQRLITLWEETYLEDGLITPNATGDWMDTIMRPSSTYANLCALHMFTIAPALGLETLTGARDLEEAIKKDRLQGNHFVDYARTTRRSIDASVIALYLELFDVPQREKLADALAQGPEIVPYPIRCTTSSYPKDIVSPVVRFFPHYHDGIWLHLGMMYLNGIKKLGRDISSSIQSIDALSMEYGNMLETLTPEGKLYSSPFHSTEYGLTMTAGQYLELIQSARPD